MNDLLHKGQAWLSAKLTQHASREVIYRRGDAEFTVTATIGKTVAEQDTGNGLVLKAEIRDYLINTKDLVLAGENILPKRGDQIVEADGRIHRRYWQHWPTSIVIPKRNHDRLVRTISIQCCSPTHQNR